MFGQRKVCARVTNPYKDTNDKGHAPKEHLLLCLVFAPIGPLSSQEVQQVGHRPGPPPPQPSPRPLLANSLRHRDKSSVETLKLKLTKLRESGRDIPLVLW